MVPSKFKSLVILSLLNQSNMKETKKTTLIKKPIPYFHTPLVCLQHIQGLLIFLW